MLNSIFIPFPKLDCFLGPNLDSPFHGDIKNGLKLHCHVEMIVKLNVELDIKFVKTRKKIIIISILILFQKHQNN